MKTVRFISFIGRTCAGKGEEARRLVAALRNAVSFSFGQLLRDSGEDPNHPLHDDLRVIREESEAGLLSSEEETQPFIEVAIRNLYDSGVQTVITDGLPRTAKQTELMLEFLDRLRAEGYEIDERYIYFFTPQEFTTERVERRRLSFLMAGKPMRADDQFSKVKVRKEEYEIKTWAAVRALAERHQLRVVDARQSFDEIHAAVMRELVSNEVRSLDEAAQELRDWTGKEQHIPSPNYESRMERR